MLLHCGAQCSIISPSIPSALIEERVRRADAREGGQLRKKVGNGGGGVVDPSRKRRRYCVPLQFLRREEPGTRTSLATLSFDVLGGHGSLDRDEPRNTKSRRKSRPFESKPTHTHPLESRTTESSSAVEWSVSE